MGHRLSLAYLTVSGAAPVEQIEAAAAAGFDSVGLRFLAPGDLVLEHEILGNKPLIRDIKLACQRTGIDVLDVEQWTLSANTDLKRLLPAIETAAEIGASFVQCVSEDPDRNRALDHYRALCDAAAPFGMRVALEFMKWREIKTIEGALAFVNQADRINGGIMIDTLHLSRSGGTPAAVAEVPSERLVYVQLCDASAHVPQLEELRQEARTGRLYPGEGSLWLKEVLDVLRPNVPLSIEAPSSLHAGQSVEERALSAARALTAFFARCRAEPKEALARSSA
jgi:sugar phosphate isomerase/epimerase